MKGLSIYYSTFGYFTNSIGTKIKKKNNLVVGNLETENLMQING